MVFGLFGIHWVLSVMETAEDLRWWDGGEDIIGFEVCQQWR